MDYKRIYKSLCESRKYRGLYKQPDYQIHHIVPKSLGGGNEDSNLVKLTYREHKVAHKLLTKITKGLDYLKMYYSYLFFSKEEPDQNKITELSNLEDRPLNMFPLKDAWLSAMETESSGSDLKNSSKCRYRSYMNVQGLREPRTNRKESLLFNLLFVCCKKGFEGVYGISYLKRSTRGSKGSSKMWKKLVKCEILDEKGFFKEEFKTYCRTSNFKVPKTWQDLLYANNTKSPYISDVLLLLNKGVKNNVIYFKRFSRGKYFLVKSNKGLTRYDKYLYRYYDHKSCLTLIEVLLKITKK